MANCFGEVVDNYKLDEMEKYVGKTKTQRDGAREAMNLINEDDKNSKAKTYVDNVKGYYGSGVSTLCLVYNATGDTIYYVADHDWTGFISRTPYPTEIGNGQWASFQHVHNTHSFIGSKAAVVYRGKNNSGYYRDCMIAWSTPFVGSSNKAYSEMGGCDSFQGRWKDLLKSLENSGYTDTTDRDGIQMDVDTETGGAPIFHATIKIPF